MFPMISLMWIFQLYSVFPCCRSGTSTLIVSTQLAAREQNNRQRQSKHCCFLSDLESNITIESNKSNACACEHIKYQKPCRGELLRCHFISMPTYWKIHIKNYTQKPTVRQRRHGNSLCHAAGAVGAQSKWHQGSSVNCKNGFQPSAADARFML